MSSDNGRVLYGRQRRSIVLVLIKLTKIAVALWLRCGSCKLIFYIISFFFAKFKNVVHSLEPGETLSNSYLKTVRRGYGEVALIFFNLL